MFRFRPLLSLLMLCGALGASPQATATPTVSAQLVSLDNNRGETFHLTLRTQEGLERFVFHPRESATTTTDELHLSGFARPRNFQREKLPSALTITDRRAWVFFTSRRTGRPAAAIITLSRTDANFLSKKVRVSRVPERALECGSHAAEDGEAIVSSGTARKRRVNRSGDTTAQAAKAALFTPARVLEVATEADYEFFAVHGAETNTYIRAVLNAVDTIYASRLGIRVSVVGQRVDTTFSRSRAAVDALELLEEFRQGSFAANSQADVRHLFTGRPVTGMTIGIAYVAATCTLGGNYAVSLSRKVSAGLQPFLAAHEIAHNLSANHDSESNSIMNPAITEENNRFSSQALNKIYDFVTTTGSCLGTSNLSAAKVTLNGMDPTRFEAKATFTASDAGACSVTLYGSSDGRRYTPVSSQRTPQNSTTELRSVSFAAKAPTLKSPQTFYFKAKVQCGGNRLISPPAKLRYGFATSGATTRRGSSRWLEQLRRNLR